MPLARKIEREASGTRTEWNSSTRIPKVQASACEQWLPAYLILGPPERPVVSAAGAQGPSKYSFFHS